MDNDKNIIHFLSDITGISDDTVEDMFYDIYDTNDSEMNDEFFNKIDEDY